MVPENARSNYGQTYLSLASALNFTYLDGLAKGLGPANINRRPLHHLIQHNALLRVAREAGYRTVVIGSDYQATEGFADVDECVCPRYGLDEVEAFAMNLTPLAALPVARWTSDAHRRKVLDSFSVVEHLSTLPGPKFVFTHIVAPHPPFLFAADGGERRTSAEAGFTFGDGDHFPGTRADYSAGYQEQARFITRRLKQTVEKLVAEKREAVIVIHGDHGPGRELRWESVEETNIEERFQIFGAYRLPGTSGREVSLVSPINVTRTLAREYLGLNLPPVADRSFYSRWTRPYDFVPVGNTDQQPQTLPAASDPHPREPGS